MVKMPPEVSETLEKQWPIPFATSSLRRRKANVVFMGILKIKDDETLVFADNFFNKTATDLAENPWASVVCWTKDPRRSYQIKGKVTFAEEGPIFEEMAASVRARRGRTSDEAGRDIQGRGGLRGQLRPHRRREDRLIWAALPSGRTLPPPVLSPHFLFLFLSPLPSSTGLGERGWAPVSVGLINVPDYLSDLFRTPPFRRKE